MRGTQLARQWKILRIIESRKRGISGRELAKSLGAPLRTVYRDLETIHEAGFPIYTDRVGRNSHWKLLDSLKQNFPVPLTITELMALHLSRDLLSIFQATIFYESIEALFRKITASLAPAALQYLDNISGRLKISLGPPKDLESMKNAIKSLSEATAKRRRVEIVYRAVSTRRTTKRKVDPYQVWVMNGAFYLIGLCHVRHEIRTFAMDRIKEFRVLKESFHLPKDFKLEEYLETAFRVMRGVPRRVKVRFPAKVAHVVRERIWHPSQEIEELSGGEIELSLEVPINYEIVSWILGFGSSAEVIEPASLRKRIWEELRNAVARYQEPMPSTKPYTKKISAHVS